MNRPLAYLARRLGLMVVTLLGISLVTFAILNVAPGGPVEQTLQSIRLAKTGAGARSVSPDVVEALRRQYGFDKPLLTRYGDWLRKLATFDFGQSFVYGRPVNDVILERLPVSLQFGALAFVLTYGISIALSLRMAFRRERVFDTVSGLLLVCLSSIPMFIVGILLIVGLAGGSAGWHLFPAGYLYGDDYETLSFGAKVVDRLHHLVLPLICYVAGSLTVLSFLGRNSLCEELGKDYLRVARAKGVDEWTLLTKHAFRNAVIPLVTGIGGTLAMFLGGSVLVENIFQLPGIGMLGFQGILARDYNLIMGLICFSSVIMLAGNLIGDFLYVWIDPRVSYE